MSDSKDIDKVWDIMKEKSFCMLATTNGGQLRARPMKAFLDRPKGTVDFVTGARTHKDDEIMADPRVCLAFAGDDFTYLSVSGRATVRRDQARVKALWSNDMGAYFDGPDDPDIRILTVHLEDAEYWDAPSSSIVIALQHAAARVIGTKPPDVGENKKVRIG